VRRGQPLQRERMSPREALTASVFLPFPSFIGSDVLVCCRRFAPSHLMAKVFGAQTGSCDALLRAQVTPRSSVDRRQNYWPFSRQESTTVIRKCWFPRHLDGS